MSAEVVVLGFYVREEVPGRVDFDPFCERFPVTGQQKGVCWQASGLVAPGLTVLVFGSVDLVGVSLQMKQLEHRSRRCVVDEIVRTGEPLTVMVRPSSSPSAKPEEG